MMFRSGATLIALSLVAWSLAAGSAAAQAGSSHGARPSDVIRDAERAALRVQHLLASVREHDAPDRATCVDGHLSQIHQTLRLALSRRARLADAERRGDRVHVERETALVRRLGDDVRRLEMQARACVDPEPPLPSGRTRVTVIIEPWVPELDVALLPQPASRPFGR